jgi:plastocyanin
MRHFSRLYWDMLPSAVFALALTTLLVAGCKASNNGAKSPTTLPATATAVPTAANTSPTPRSLSPTPAAPTPARSPVSTSAPRVGVAGQVVISAAGFAPREITVATGRPVTFVNNDSVAHRVVSAMAGVFDTGDIPPGGSASVTIASTGFTDFHDAATPARGGTITTLP